MTHGTPVHAVVRAQPGVDLSFQSRSHDALWLKAGHVRDDQEGPRVAKVDTSAKKVLSVVTMGSLGTTENIVSEIHLLNPCIC